MFGIDDIAAATLIGGGLNLAGDLFSQSNAREAFQTRYQDTVKDMRKAGLNPALAYGQGGGNPQTMNFGDWGSSAAQAAQAIATSKKTSAEAENVKQQTELLKGQMEALRLYPSVRNTLMNRQAEQAGSAADVNTAMAGIRELQRKRDAETFQSDIEARKAANLIEQLGVPQARAYAKYYQSPVGKAEPYLSTAQDVAKTAAQLYGARGLNKPRHNTYNIQPRNR